MGRWLVGIIYQNYTHSSRLDQQPRALTAQLGSHTKTDTKAKEKKKERERERGNKKKYACIY